MHDVRAHTPCVPRGEDSGECHAAGCDQRVARLQFEAPIGAGYGVDRNPGAARGVGERGSRRTGNTGRDAARQASKQVEERVLCTAHSPRMVYAEYSHARPRWSSASLRDAALGVSRDKSTGVRWGSGPPRRRHANFRDVVSLTDARPGAQP